MVLEMQRTYRERPVFFSAGRHALSGVLTEPVAPPPLGVAVIALPGGGGFMPGFNRNRWSVRLIRRLAAEGYHGLRFDYHGVGDSTGAIGGYWLDRPFDDDLLGAVAYLTSVGLERVVLVGSCFGARTIMAAADRIRGLEGAVLISTPLRDFQMGERIATSLALEKSTVQLVRAGLSGRVLRKLRARGAVKSYARIAVRATAARLVRLTDRWMKRRDERNGGDPDWMSRHYRKHLEGLARRRVPVLFVYGLDEGFYREFQRARSETLGALLEESPGIEVRTVDGDAHGLTTLAVQDAVLEATVGWITSTWRRAPVESAGVLPASPA